MPHVLGDRAEQIETDGVFRVGWIEIDDIVGTGWGNMIQQLFGEIAVRIDDADTFAGTNVLENQIAKQSRLAASGFAEAVHVVAAVSARKTERLISAPHVSLTDIDDVVFADHGSGANGYSKSSRLLRLVKERNAKALATNVLYRVAKVIAACFGP